MQHRITVRSGREIQNRNCRVLGCEASIPCNLKCRRNRKTDSQSSAWRLVHGQLIEELKTALAGASRKSETIEDYVTALRMFSEFLRPKGVTLKDLPGNVDLLTAYKDEFMKMASANSRTMWVEHWKHSTCSTVSLSLLSGPVSSSPNNRSWG
ncbi:hypothetical protein [Bradyrhizobium sp. LCT2]|uniref:hypothetical protein n=1 Tax=Bradyrhizobium sp. LCT2 TaxID=2493093 RepID=UPI001AEDC069|nr:hypothetical protein [Bradyrhizobium sp. LCT2]